MNALLRKWPRRQGRMILQAIYDQSPRVVSKTAPAELDVKWNETVAPEPVFAGSESTPQAIVEPVPASNA